MIIGYVSKSNTITVYNTKGTYNNIVLRIEGTNIRY